MNLDEYLFFNKLEVREFCKECFVSAGYLCSIRTKNKRPSLKTAKFISDATGGKVSVEELRKMPEKKEEPDLFEKKE